MVAAAVLAEHGAEVDFYGAVGSDAIGDAAVRELTERGITVHAARRPGPTREVLTLLDRRGERTILPIGERLQPEGADTLEWDRLADADGVYVTAGDPGALERARAARVLVATPRLRERVEDPGVQIDALVFSASDETEVSWARRLRVRRPADGGHRGRRRWPLVGRVRGPLDGGAAARSGARRLRLRRLPSPPGSPTASARARSVAEACEIGARWGAEMLTRVGAP